MKRFLYIFVFTMAFILLISSEMFKHVFATSVRQQCQQFLKHTHAYSISRPQLVNVDEIVLTKYLRMQTIRLKNQGGVELLYCDGFNLPRGLNVTLTYDGHSCKISGIPAQEQANTMAYVVTANKTGRSLAEVPIVVNALILHE